MDRKAEPSSEDQTLVNGSNGYYENDRIVIEDWSQTGRGSHVDFGDHETVPLQPGRFLGRGAMGDVHEITLQGWKLAHKRMLFRRKIGEKEKNEIEILKRLSHIHVIQLIGTYTQQNFLGILLYPVAVCDLHTLFEDIETWAATYDGKTDRLKRYHNLEPAHRNRLITLGYDFPADLGSSFAAPAYHKIGCLVSAIVYLHEQKIRHKDLKPSNILLSQDHLWLTDFGSATDFTYLSQSATDNERGTPRYFAPEMAQWKPSGRAADIFSLGCILLEILVLDRDGTLDCIRKNRSLDPSFHANLDKVDTWLALPFWLSCKTPDLLKHQRELMLALEIQSMLAMDPEKRPTASNVFAGITACDLKTRPLKPSIFGDCCKIALASSQQIEKQTAKYKTQIASLQALLGRVNEEATRQAAHIAAAEVESAKQQSLIRDYEANIDTIRSEMDYFKNQLAEVRWSENQLSSRNKEQEEVILELRERLDSLTAQSKSEERGDTLTPYTSFLGNESSVDLPGRHAPPGTPSENQSTPGIYFGSRNNSSIFFPAPPLPGYFSDPDSGGYIWQTGSRSASVDFENANALQTRGRKGKLEGIVSGAKKLYPQAREAYQKARGGYSSR